MKPEHMTPQMSSSSLNRLNGTNRCMKNFHRRYLTLCRAKNYQPLAELVGNSGGGAGVCKSKTDHGWQTVNFFGDRLKETDWQLITDALREDSSLELLAIRLRKVLNDVLDNGCHRMDAVIDRPVILVKRLFTKLMDCLESFLVNNQTVKTLVLEALPIQGIYMGTFINGLQQNCSITELSLARSAIRDEGCEAICSAVMHLPKIESLNMSGCQLTARGCQSVAELVKYQKIKRFAQSWQYSLRYGDVHTEKMQGLRVLSLSSNPHIGDEGMSELTEVLKDDEWIRQIHFRNCGLTDNGAKLLVDCLNFNKTIKNFDIRSNSGISSEALHGILVKLGGEVVPSDGRQSVQETRIVGHRKMKAGEQNKYLQQQLAAERHRSTELQALVEQLHQQQEEYAMQSKMQFNKLKQDYGLLLNQRDELLNKVQCLQKTRPQSKKINLRKSKSVALPSDFFSHPANVVDQCKGRANPGAKSEMTLRWVDDAGASGHTKRTQVMDRMIGDSELNTRRNQFALEPVLEVEQDGICEDGFGDIGLGCSKVTIRKTELDNQHKGRPQSKAFSVFSEDEYFDDVEEAADQQFGNDLTDRNPKKEDEKEEDDDEDDEIGYDISGVDLLKIVARKMSMEAINDTQSLFMSAYSGDEN
ncbi:protein Cep78 homolog [Ochlerotatus camptorhynchus]|uniref:protein Cep78 homolog n=1 Tax=Ochlerotatus camptorhynchus TaxID=644619 RepID=UPI0031D2DBB0